jgi:porphobilinogen synthase
MQFPSTRLRRLRTTPWVRNMVQENRLTVNDLIWPIFVQDGTDAQTAIASMPGVNRLTVDRIVAAVKEAADLGIPAVALFPNTPIEKKTEDGSEACNADNLVCRAVRAVREAKIPISIICDVALDPYTSHGHDGLLQDGIILNDETVEILCEQALTLAQAGCDIIAPSDMMDGRIGIIRAALDDAGFPDVMILSYAVKYASSFYGPFRDAVGSKNLLKGDKKTYQMNPGNSAEGLREAQLDIEEGADMVMIKPGLPYLDMIARVKDTFGMPTVAYQVSGEYSMIKAAAANGWIDGDKTMLETLLCFKRAGADAILTYAAIDVAKMLKAGI